MSLDKSIYKTLPLVLFIFLLSGNSVASTSHDEDDKAELKLAKDECVKWADTLMKKYDPTKYGQHTLDDLRSNFFSKCISVESEVIYGIDNMLDTGATNMDVINRCAKLINERGIKFPDLVFVQLNTCIAQIQK